MNLTTTLALAIGIAYLAYLVLIIATIVDIVRRPSHQWANARWTRGQAIGVIVVAGVFGILFPLVAYYWLVLRKQLDAHPG